MQSLFAGSGRISFGIILGLLITDVLATGMVHAAQQPVSIIAFGDSITTGYPYYPYWNAQDGAGKGTTGGGYEPTTSVDMRNQGILATVYNWGQSGEFAGDGVNRLEYVLNRQTADYVLLMEGTNDLTFGFGCASVTQSLSIMIDKVVFHGAVPLLSTITPDSRSGLEYKNIPYCNEKIKQLAADKGVFLVDNYQAVVGEWYYWGGNTYEGLHPSDNGYVVLGMNWSKALQEVMRSKIAPIFLLLLRQG